MLVCVAFSLLFFFLQKDMGPAMVFTCLFLVLYSIAISSILSRSSSARYLEEHSFHNSCKEGSIALLDAATGLRVSELLALRWCDVDFENLALRVTPVDLASSSRQLQDGSLSQTCVNTPLQLRHSA